MTSRPSDTEKDSFYSLSPDQVLNSVEASLQKKFPGLRATGRASALNSLENRVFEIEIESKIEGEASVVAKFYRPGRWSREQIAEEHAFVAELKNAEVPVVAALIDLERTEEGIFFTVFPKMRGRLKDELGAEELRQLGRFLAQLHNVGERFRVRHRLHLDLDTYGLKPLQLLVNSEFLDEVTRPRYEKICRDLFAVIEPLLKRQPSQALHGDCHVGNILWNESGPFLLDFDDMLSGPPVQDIWMIAKGRSDEDLQLREELLTGYEMMRDFDRGTLRIIEALRALRMIHYSAWIARRWSDPSFPKMFTEFATQRYWFEEIQALEETLQFISGPPSF